MTASLLHDRYILLDTLDFNIAAFYTHDGSMIDMLNLKLLAQTTATIAIAWSSAVSALPIVNGDFETIGSYTTNGNGGAAGRTQDSLTGSRGSSWGVFDALQGWTKGSGTAGIEIQTSNTIGSLPMLTGSNYYVELDSHGNRGTTNSSMHQNIGTLVASQKYQLSFWYAARTNDPLTNGIRYAVDGAASGGFGSTTGSGSDANQWRLVTSVFTASSSALSLGFYADGTDDSYGGFIDNISVRAVPLPPAGILLFSALGGLGLISRRRKTA